MKLFKTSVLLILLGLSFLAGKGQTGVSYKIGFSIPEMESLMDELSYENHKVLLERKGFSTVSIKTNPDIFLYEKADKTQLKVFSEEKKIKRISFSADKSMYLKVSGELENNSYQKIQQLGRFSTYNKNHYILILDPSEYTFTISISGSRTAIKTSPAPIVPKPSTLPRIFANDGNTINELHELVDLLTLANYRSVLEQRGMKLERNDIEAGRITFKRNDDVTLSINLKAGMLSSVHFLLSPESFKKATALIPGNSDFMKSGEEPSGTGTLTRYKYKGHDLSTNNAYFRITMWPNETSNSNIINVSETYYSAKQIADAMNQKMFKATVGHEDPNYKFEVLGSMNLDKRSIRFIDKNGILYLQVNIPRNGGCDYGLKEFKANYAGSISWGDDYFYVPFIFKYECSNTLYRSVYIHFKPSSSFSKQGIENWIRKYANFKVVD